MKMKLQLKSIYSKLAVIGGASAFQMGCQMLLSLVLAKIMMPEDFGITRTVAAYFLVAVMFGHVCLHDGIATYVAGASSPEEKKRWTANGILLVLLASASCVVLAEIVIGSGWIWTGKLRVVMAIVFLFLPAVALSVVYTSLLQALGAHRKIVFSLVLGGLIPLLIMLPGVWFGGLRGWVFTRCLSYAAVAVLAFWLVRHLGGWERPDIPVMKKLLEFVKFQFSSGLISMCLQSADVIALDRLVGRMDLIGYYSLGIMFSSASIFILHTIDRVYFKELSEAFAAGHDFWTRVGKLMGVAAVFCLGIFVAMNLIGPWFIRLIFGDVYEASIPVLRISSVGIFFSGFWAVISMINVIIKMPRYSLAISIAGLGTAVVLLAAVTPVYGIQGTAWCMNAAYAVGVIMGFALLWRFKKAQEKSVR
jgi:O-antigen/teichoic acid export membrane protein